MNNRQRFQATMHYQPRDRSPITDFGFWEETVVLWHDQGLPESVQVKKNISNYLGMDYGMDYVSAAVGVNVGLYPGFEEIQLEDLGDREVVQQSDGVRVLRQKFMRSIPHPVSHLLTDRETWKKHYLPRLDPTNPGRYPEDWDERVKYWTDPNREEIVALNAGSLVGKLRDWMGLENLIYTVHDDPALFDEMVTTLADCAIAALTRVLETGGKFDGCGMWEDMAYNAGPLLSPRHWKKYVMPHYRRITDLLHKYGVDVIWLDCDGKIDALIPMWLDVGVNCMFPLEIGTWGTDPVKYRQEYGKDLLMMGGFDKHILAQSKEAIEAEVCRLAPLVEEGGFIGFCDHRVPPDVPYENYLYYLEMVRKVWGHGVNLKPMFELPASLPAWVKP